MEVGHVGLKAPKKRKSKLDPYRADMIGWIGKQPDLTLAELCARLYEIYGLRAGSSTLDDWLRANQITYKKKRLTPVNRSGLMCGPNAAVGENARIG